jgi:hypothetical protein
MRPHAVTHSFGRSCAEGRTMGTPIRIRASTWGTCFCVQRAGAIRFITACHVLIDCGCTAGAEGFQASLCDEKHFPEDAVYDLTNITWEHDCDYVEFDCAFPGDPYIANPALIQADAAIDLRGYLRTAARSGDIPGCDRALGYGGSIVGTTQECASGRRLVTVTLQFPDPSPHGLSGSPVTFKRTSEVVSIFCAGPNQAGRCFTGPEVS